MKDSGFKFSNRSTNNFEGVHAHLIILTTYTLMTSPLDFVIISGVRTREEQRKLVKAGASKTMDSRHLTGHAVDFAVLVEGVIRWEAAVYKKVADKFYEASERFGYPITWGGEWGWDFGHVELHRDHY